MNEREPIDRILVDAFLDVSPPSGLESRVLNRLAESAQPEAASVALAPRASRRRWLAVASMTVAASLVALLAYFWPGGTNRLTAESLQAEAMRRYDQDAQMADRLESARPWTGDPKLTAHPISQLLQIHHRPTWRPVTGLLGLTGVAYDLTGRGNARARLYVLRCPAANLPSSPYRHAPVETGGLWSTAWREGDLAYVLVIPARGIADPAGQFLNGPAPIL